MAISTAREPVITYKVYYEAKPSYQGSWNVPEKPGFQGPFDLYEDAVLAVESCKRWFNEERKVTEQIDREGKVTQTVRVVNHDNVYVEIKKFKDGFPCEEEVVCEEEPKSRRKKEPAPA